MVVTCHACQTKFRVDDSKIGPRGVKVKCSKCATMLVVKPSEDEATKVGEAPPETMAAARGELGRFDAEEAPSAPQDSIRTRPTDLFGLGMPGDLLADDTEHDVPTTVGPPPRPPAPPPLAPPPLKPPVPPTLETAIGSEKPPGAWQAQTPAPTPPEAQTAAAGAGLGDDLFSDPFAQSGAPPPPPSAAESDQQRFADIEPSSGPSLELDLDTGSAKGAPDLGDSDPLAGMPKFDESDDAPPAFNGAMSSEGNVTRPVVLANLQGAPQQPARVLDENKAAKVAPLVTPPPVPAQDRKKPRSNRKAVAVVGYVAIILLVVAGLFGEYMLFRAGGYEGLLGHRDRLNAPVALGVELGRVTLAPFVSHYGDRFVIIRGELHNKTAQASPAFVVDISLDGKKVTSAKPGSAVDPVALYEHGKIEEKIAAETTLAASETRTFTVAIPAPKESRNLQESVVFSVAAR